MPFGKQETANRGHTPLPHSARVKPRLARLKPRYKPEPRPEQKPNLRVGPKLLLS